jgi:hypothetical protein
MADGANEHVRIYDRKTMTEPTASVTAAASRACSSAYSIAVDSKGNIYTTETYTGKRLQKFVSRASARFEEQQGSGLAGIG